MKEEKIKQKANSKYISAIADIKGLGELLLECDYDFHAGRSIEKLAGFIEKARQEERERIERLFINHSEQTKDWQDELFNLAEKYCKHDGGEMNNCLFWIFKPFIEKLLAKKEKEVINEYLKSEEGKVYQDYQELKKQAKKEVKEKILKALPKLYLPLSCERQIKELLK